MSSQADKGIGFINREKGVACTIAGIAGAV